MGPLMSLIYLLSTTGIRDFVFVSFSVAQFYLAKFQHLSVILKAFTSILSNILNTSRDNSVSCTKMRRSSLINTTTNVFKVLVI